MRRTISLRSTIPFDRVFVINLPSRPERWESISTQLSSCGIPTDRVTRYNAVVGKNLNPTRMEERGFVSRLGHLRLESKPSEKIWGMDLNLGAMGCALSHVDLWATIAAQRLGCALVLEDDSLIPLNFLELFVERMRHVPPVCSHPPEPWSLVYVSGLDTAHQCPNLLVAPGVARVPQFHRTTNAYVTHAAGAEELLSSCVPLTYQLDTQMTMNCELFHSTDANLSIQCVSRPRCFTLFPPLIAQATRFGSDIQEHSSPNLIEEASRCQAAGIRTRDSAGLSPSSS